MMVDIYQMIESTREAADKADLAGNQQLVNAQLIIAVNRLADIATGLMKALEKSRQELNEERLAQRPLGAAEFNQQRLQMLGCKECPTPERI
jgi:hypothetical protein